MFTISDLNNGVSQVRGQSAQHAEYCTLCLLTPLKSNYKIFGQLKIHPLDAFSGHSVVQETHPPKCHSSGHTTSQHDHCLLLGGKLRIMNCNLSNELYLARDFCSSWASSLYSLPFLTSTVWPKLLLDLLTTATTSFLLNLSMLETCMVLFPPLSIQ